MNKILLFALLFLSVCTYAQELKVLSCSLNEQDSTAIVSPRFDFNDKMSAVIIVEMNGALLSFRGSILGDVIYTGQHYIVYVPDRTKRLHIYGEGYLPKQLDFTDYPESRNGVVGGCTYHVEISSEAPAKVYDNNCTNVLLFQSNTPLSKVIVNGMQWKTSSNIAKRIVPCGMYHYEIYSDSKKVITGDVEVQESLESKIVEICF